VTVTALSPSTPFAYALRDARLFLGTSAAAVSRALAATSDPRASGRVDRVRSAFFPDAADFALADLRSIHDIADRRRPAVLRRLAARQDRPEAEVARDLDQALALIDLFDAGFLTSTLSPDSSGAHRSFGLVRLAPPRP
jgi:hypothetical protein